VPAGTSASVGDNLFTKACLTGLLRELVVMSAEMGSFAAKSLKESCSEQIVGQLTV